jgi:DNA-binding IclR family transcriptional regulator
VLRHGTGPSSLPALRSLLVDVRRRGWAVEQGEVTPGLRSVAAAVLDASGHPVAAVAVTYPDPDRGPPPGAGAARQAGARPGPGVHRGPHPHGADRDAELAGVVRATAADLSRRLGAG